MSTPQAAEHAHLVEGVGLDLDQNAGLPAMRLLGGSLDAVRITFHRKVVVLGEHAVEQAEAVVGAASGADGEPLELAESGCGFAGVEDDGLGAGHGLDELTGEGGDAGESLKEIQGRAFGGEEGAGGAPGGEDGVTG